MKVTRRSFVGLVSVGAATIVASLFLKQWPLTTPSNSFERLRGTMATEDAQDFPVTWNGDYPTQIDLEGYRLRVEGGVSPPLEFTIEELRAMPTVSGWSTINCVEGWSAPVQWEGIPLSRLLNLARAPKNTDYVRVEGVTGYVARIRRSEVEDPATMIALKAGGIPLTIEHGYPARLVVSTRPGLDWVKYVSRIRPGV